MHYYLIFLLLSICYDGSSIVNKLYFFLINRYKFSYLKGYMFFFILNCFCFSSHKKLASSLQLFLKIASPILPQPILSSRPPDPPPPPSHCPPCPSPPSPTLSPVKLQHFQGMGAYSERGRARERERSGLGKVFCGRKVAIFSAVFAHVQAKMAKLFYRNF